jgi:hypothetical protein
MDFDRKNLPRDIDQCHALIAQLAQELEAKESRLRGLLHELARLLRRRWWQGMKTWGWSGRMSRRGGQRRLPVTGVSGCRLIWSGGGWSMILTLVSGAARNAIKSLSL